MFQKCFDYIVRSLGSFLWIVVRCFSVLSRHRDISVPWSDKSLIKSRTRTFPNLGFPRETYSVCPECVVETRKEILTGKMDWQVLTQDSHPCKIKASLYEKDGKIWMEKTCPKHGTFNDYISILPEFTKRMEMLHPGRDFALPADEHHNHGPSSLKYGRGAVYTIDLTNRCNMMCSPCFMDANHGNSVHELSLDEIKKILDMASSVRPKRQMSIQFSGGEPTLSPHFLDAIRYAKKLGFFSVQAATNGIRFAQEPQFVREAAEAGLKFAYLQFDGATNESMSFRGVSNLLDVKQEAIDNLALFGIPTALVVTVIKGINDSQLKAIYDFALRNIEKIHTIAIQPVSFSGREEGLPEEERLKMRYTTTHLITDFKEQLGFLEPMRDWFPLSVSGPFSDLIDLIHAQKAQWGAMRCSCHPDCGAGTFVMVDMETKESTPVPKFFDLERFLRDVTLINDWAPSPWMCKLLTVLTMLRNFNPYNAPKGMHIMDFLKQVDSHMGGSITGNRTKRFRWGMLSILSMWFQDLWNYDFHRSEMCGVPYGTQMGEIPFCAYNTGVGWRYVVQNLHQTAKLSEWFQEKGRHHIYVKGEAVEIKPEKEESAKLP